MKKKTNIKELKITNSCMADWENMSKKKASRHCKLCNKTVYDFTNLNETEIINFFENHVSNKKKTCGRFNRNQLRHINLELNTKSNYISRLSPYLLGLMLTSVGCKVYKQEQISCNAQNSSIEIFDPLGKDSLRNNTIYGQILSTDNEPLPFAVVSIKGTDRGIESDLNGNFELDISGLDLDQYYLHTSYLGYQAIEVKLFDIKENRFKIKLAGEYDLMGEVVVVRSPFYKKIFQRRRN